MPARSIRRAVERAQAAGCQAEDAVDVEEGCDWAAHGVGSTQEGTKGREDQAQGDRTFVQALSIQLTWSGMLSVCSHGLSRRGSW